MPPHDFWQEVLAPGTYPPQARFDAYFPATFDDGRQLLLPVRPLPDGAHAVASLIINQASFAVTEALAHDLAAKLADFQPEVVVGLPTLGLTLAARVAALLGHARYVPLGTSRKFWYSEELSAPISSITTPDQQKRVYADPRMLPLLQARRVALVDDAISSGVSMQAGLRLMAACGVQPAVLGVAMLQSERWRVPLADWRPRIARVFDSPVLARHQAGGWVRAEAGS